MRPAGAGGRGHEADGDMSGARGADAGDQGCSV